MTEKKPLTMRVREAPPPKPKRVYKTVAVGEDAPFAILLDGKSALTPLRVPLKASSKALAAAVAAEWDAQEPHVDPETMPLTRLLATAIDRVSTQREAVIDSLLGYVDADSICYRAAHPADLRERQKAVWQPVIDWLARDGDIVLASVDGLMPAAQNPEVAERMRKALAALDDTELTAFQAAASLANSLALAFALVRGRLSAADVFAAAFLDELYQEEKWGEDTEALDRRRRIAGDLTAIGRYLELART